MEYGYSTEKDQKAAEMLSNMIKRKALRVSQIQKKIEGKEILVIGAGPSLEKLGAIMVIHAHGDNIENLEKNVPKFRKIIGTTQVMPTENVYNFGGFTDGDRGVFLAEEMRAKSITLIGMDFNSNPRKFSNDHDIDFELKRKKLKTAKRLLEMLGKQSKSKLINKSGTKIRGIKSQ